MNEGFCDVDLSAFNDDAEPVLLLDTKMVRARKAHRCEECDSAIAQGEEHWRASYRFEGKFWTERRCAACQETAATFGHQSFGGVLWEALENEWDRGARVAACMNRLTTVAAKERMRRQWLKWKGLSPHA